MPHAWRTRGEPTEVVHEHWNAMLATLVAVHRSHLDENEREDASREFLQRRKLVRIASGRASRTRKLTLINSWPVRVLLIFSATTPCPLSFCLSAVQPPAVPLRICFGRLTFPSPPSPSPESSGVVDPEAPLVDLLLAAPQRLILRTDAETPDGPPTSPIVSLSSSSHSSTPSRAFCFPPLLPTDEARLRPPSAAPRDSARGRSP